MTTRLPLRTRGLAAVPALSMLLLGAPIPARAQAPDGSTPPPTAGTAMRGSTASPTGGGCSETDRCVASTGGSRRC